MVNDSLDAINANVACVTTFMCHPDEDEAMRRGLEGANFFGYSLAHYYVFGRHRPAVTNVWDEFEQRRAAHGYDPELVRQVARLVDKSEYKRQQAAPGIKVTSKAFGIGRRFPIAQKYVE